MNMHTYLDDLFINGIAIIKNGENVPYEEIIDLPADPDRFYRAVSQALVYSRHEIDRKAPPGER